MLFLDSQPASIAKILDNCFKLYSVCFVKILGYAAIIALWSIILNTLTEQYLGGNPTDPAAAQLYLTETLPKYMGIIFLASVLLWIVYIALIRRIDNVVHENQADWSDELREGLSKLPASIFGMILYTLAVIVGSILLVIPGLIFSLSLVFYIYFIALESMGGYQSLKESHKLVWGHWWRTMTVFLVPGIFAMIIYFAFVFLSAFLFDPSSVLFSIVYSIISALITPFFLVVCYVQFHDLKLRKTGMDLELRMAG